MYLDGTRYRMWGKVSVCAHIRAKAGYTLSMFLLYVKCGAELDVCHLSLEVQFRISVDYSLKLSIGKSVKKNG